MTKKDLIRRHVTMPQELVSQILAFQTENDIATFSDAVEHLVNLQLKGKFHQSYGLVFKRPVPLPESDLMNFIDITRTIINRYITSENISIYGNKTIVSGHYMSLYYEVRSDIQVLPSLEKIAASIEERIRLKTNVRLQQNNIIIELSLPEAHRYNRTFSSIFTDDFIIETRQESKVKAIIGERPDGSLLTVDLNLLPHALVGGMENSSRQTFLQNVIISLQHINTPSEVQFHVYDSTGVTYKSLLKDEYVARYTSGIEKVSDGYHILEKLQEISDERYQLFAKKGVRNIEEFKKSFGTLPYHVVIIDDWMDIIGAYKESEKALMHLLQRVRAVGIIILLSTAMPRREVVSDLLKMNLPSRITGRTSSDIDSKIIMNITGAERLLNDEIIIGDYTSPLKYGTVIDFTKEEGFEV